MDLERRAGRARRRVTPEVVDQPLGGHDVVRVQQQHCEHRALLARAEVELDVVVVRLEPPEHVKAQPRRAARHGFHPPSRIHRRILRRIWRVFSAV